MDNGIYRVEFQTQRGTGTGVVVINDGRILGGDSIMYYVGTFSESGNNFSTNIKARVHSNVPGMAPVFGVPEANISLTGTSTNNSAQSKGTAVEAPGISFQAVLNKL